LRCKKFAIVKWEEVKGFKHGQFRRFTGVNRALFELMVQIVSANRDASRRHPSRGQKPKLCIEDQILLTLMYYREYRTLFHIGVAFGMSESHTCRIVHQIESILLADKRLHLPGKKGLHGIDSGQVAIIDVSEHPIERPKKNSGATTLAKRSAIR